MNTANTEIAIPTQTLVTPITRLQPGLFEATVKSARMTRNGNNNRYLELICQVQNREEEACLFWTDRAMEKTAEQIQKAYGIDLNLAFKEKTVGQEIVKITGQKCRVQIDRKEYPLGSGNFSTRINWIKKSAPETISEDDLYDDLPTPIKKAETEVLF